jgi:hypothetical protein
VDREIVRLLTRNKLVGTVFENWKKAYRAISRLGTGEVSKLIADELDPKVDSKKHDLAIPHRSVVKLDFRVVRGASLPADVFVPFVKEEDASDDEVTYKVTLLLSSEDVHGVLAYYRMKGEPNQATLKELAEQIKEELMEWVEGIKHE